MSSRDSVSVTIVTYNSGRFIRRCLEAVLEQRYPHLEVIVVDNASTDGTIDILEHFEDRCGVVYNSENRGFAAAQNQAIALSRGEWVLTLNPDVFLLPGFISALMEGSRLDPAVGTVCGKLFSMEPGFEIEKIGSTGRAIAHVQIEIRDDAGQPVATGKPGEICLRGPKVTRGYWKDPERTAAAFFGDWFRSGDIGYLDADGFLYLTDRKKDIIISGGENISSSEVERVISDLPQVSEVAVVGIPDPRWGERPVAVVALAQNATLDLETLTTHCRARLASFKVPKQLIIRDSLPRNPSGKVLKRVLRAELEEAADG